MHPPPEARLTEALLALAGALHKDSALGGELDRLVRLAARTIPHCIGASITILVAGEPTSIAGSDEVVFELDAAQYEADEGPCLTALGGDMVRVAFLASDERFPHFAVGAADQRVRSVRSVPIESRGEVLGSLNLYSREEDAFDDDATALALVFIAEAAMVIDASAFRDRAVAIRRAAQADHDEFVEVSMATGALMAMQSCTAEQARRLLVNASEANDEQLVDAARRIIAVAIEADEDHHAR